MKGKKIVNVTQREIADAAGTSPSTVAAVMSENQRGRISPETQKRVLDAARKLGYRPNRYAQVMRNGRSGQIGAIHFGHNAQLAEKKVQVAVQLIHERGYQCLVQHAHWFLQSEQKEAIMQRTLVQRMLDERVEGVLLFYPDEHPVQEIVNTLHEWGIPVVAISGGEGLKSVPSFMSDRKWGYAEMTRHLIKRGCQRPALIYGGDSSPREGFENALKDYPEVAAAAQLIEAPLVVESMDNISDNGKIFLPGWVGMKKLLAGGVPFDAVICANDIWAVGALQACYREGLHVPEDFALTGFDNYPIGEFSIPPLTTIDHPLQEITTQAVECLLEMVSKGEYTLKKKKLIRGNLIVRKSCETKRR